jgi:hypothetical protein
VIHTLKIEQEAAQEKEKKNFKYLQPFKEERLCACADISFLDKLDASACPSTLPLLATRNSKSILYFHFIGF